MAKITELELALLQFGEDDAPATPAAGVVRIYSKTDGLMYIKDDEGTETCLSGSDSDVLTTKGDVLVHTGSGYVRLGVGSNGQILVADSAEANGVKWVDPENGRGIAYFWEGDVEVTAKAISFIATYAMTVSAVRCNVDTAPVGADLILDIHKNGTTLFTTQGNRPTIADGTTSDTSVAPDVTSIAIGDLITLEIDQIGSTTAGAGLALSLVCEVA